MTSEVELQNKCFTAPGVYTIVLQWTDDIYSMGQSVNGTSTDLDIYLSDDAGNPLFGFNRNNIGGDPLEVMPFTVSAATTTNIVIVRASGITNVNFKYIVFRGDLTINNFNTGNSTLVGQANAAGAMAVGAVRYNTAPAFTGNKTYIAEPFSSLGGTPVNGVVRNKPDFMAPDGVSTTVNFGPNPKHYRVSLPEIFWNILRGTTRRRCCCLIT